MYLIYKTKQVLKRNSQGKMTVGRPVKTWKRRTENNKQQLKHCGENGSKQSPLAQHCERPLSNEEPEVNSHNLHNNDLFYMTGYERMKRNTGNLTSHTISRASGILILSLLPRTTVPEKNQILPLTWGWATWQYLECKALECKLVR